MSDYMPDDVLKKILSYLPPKSLVRFTSVSKSWKTLITSSDFITDHLNQTKLSNINNKHLILLRYYPGNNQKERYYLHIDNYTFDRYDVIEPQFQSFGFYEHFRVLGGSVNGLICLCDDYGHSIIKTVILWNPSIRKSKTLPLPNFMHQTQIELEQPMGFGFDSRTNDYKVVRITYLKPKIGQSPRVQLYKLSTGSWEIITATVDPSCSVDYMYSTQAFINGAVHWPAYKTNVGSLILSFNMSDELFHEMSLPVSVVEDHNLRINMFVAVCGEWLSFFRITTNPNLDQICSVWVMKEYGVVESWTKLYTFDLNGELGKMIGFRRNGELLLAMKNKELASYDPETGHLKYLGVCDSGKNRMYSFHVDAYVESLVLLGNDEMRARKCFEIEEETEEQIPSCSIGLRNWNAFHNQSYSAGNQIMSSTIVDTASYRSLKQFVI